MVDRVVHPQFVGIQREFVGEDQFGHEDAGVDEVIEVGDILSFDLKLEPEFLLIEKPLTFVVKKVKLALADPHEERLFDVDDPPVEIFFVDHVLRLGRSHPFDGNIVLHDQVVNVLAQRLSLFTLLVDQEESDFSVLIFLPEEAEVVEVIGEGSSLVEQGPLHFEGHLDAELPDEFGEGVDGLHALEVVVFGLEVKIEQQSSIVFDDV